MMPVSFCYITNQWLKTTGHILFLTILRISYSFFRFEFSLAMVTGLLAGLDV